MATHLQYAYTLTLDLDRFREVLLCDRDSLDNTWLRHHLARIEEVTHLAEYPGSTVGCSTNHHSINAIAIEHLSRLLARIDITIADNRNLDKRIVLDLANESPISFALVELASCATVNGQRSNAHILQTEGYLLDILRIIVPTQAGLDRYGLLDRLDNLLCHLDHQWHITHHTRACTSACNLLHRTAEVDVDNIGIGRLGYACRLDHRLDLIAIDLNSHRSLEVVDIQLCTRLPRITDKSVRRDKLGSHHICAKTLADVAKRGIGNILHRSKKECLLAKFYIANFHRCL